MNNLQIKQKIALIILILPLVGIISCQSANKTEEKLAQDAGSVNKDSSLTLNDVTLENNNEKGQKVWRVKSKVATYSKDKKFVTIQNPDADLFQDGKPIYNIKALTGEVQQDGKSIFLKGQIVATNLQDGMILKGNELEWRPEQDIMFIRYGVTGAQKEGYLAAKEGKISNKGKKIELFGDVLINLKDPIVQIKTEHLTWDVPKQKLISDMATQVNKYQDKKITDSAFASKAEFDLKKRLATMIQGARIMQGQPAVQVFSQLMMWNLKDQTLISPGAVTVINTKDQITLLAKQAQGDLKKQIFVLTGNVVGNGQKNGANLQSDRLIWDANKQVFDAIGNVSYRQQKPVLFVNAARASGKLSETIVSTGDSQGGKVFTSIIPE